MISKISTETVTPEKSIGDNLNYAFNYIYNENYAHRLLCAGERYYKYDANGNVICEQDGSFDLNGDDDATYHKVTKEADDVYSTDYGWGLFKEEDESNESGTKTAKTYRRTYTWNERNQLISSVDANYSTSYIYGQDGERTNKYTSQSETLYFNKMWTLHTDSGNAIYGGQSSKNIYLGETRIVTKLNSGENPTYSEEFNKQYFYHSDHLGSASLISDSNGDEYQRIEYTPYGETWVEKTNNTGLEYLPYKFTAKEQDEETGLYYYGARYLDSRYSRWISTDPALGDYMSGTEAGCGGIYNSTNLSLYHYAGNNPIKYTDPTGMWIDNEDGTYTAEKGDHLYNLYGDDWKSKSGFTRDPRTLQIGETVGEKLISSDFTKEFNKDKVQQDRIIKNYGIGFKIALIFGLGVELGYVTDGETRGIYLTGSYGCGIQVSTGDYSSVEDLIKSSANLSGLFSPSVGVGGIQNGTTISESVDIGLGIVGTWDLKDLNKSGLPNSFSFGSVGGGYWYNSTTIFTFGRKK